MASMTQNQCNAALEACAASKGPLPHYVKDAAIQLAAAGSAALTAQIAADAATLAALQATYDAYVLAHP